MTRVLHESESSFRELFENMSDGVAVYMAVGDGEDFVFVGHNKGGERISGLPRSEVIGRSVCEVFPGVEPMGLFEVFRRVWRTGEPEHFPMTQYQDDRIAVWVDNYVYRLPDRKVVAIYRDETQRRQAEEALRNRNEELERFNRAAIGREMDMVELKRQVNALAKELGREPPFNLDFLDRAGRKEGQA